MKKFALMALLATVMVAPYAISSASGARVSDTPECCVKNRDAVRARRVAPAATKHGRSLHAARGATE